MNVAALHPAKPREVLDHVLTLTIVCGDCGAIVETDEHAMRRDVDAHKARCPRYLLDEVTP